MRHGSLAQLTEAWYFSRYGVADIDVWPISMWLMADMVFCVADMVVADVVCGRYRRFPFRDYYSVNHIKTILSVPINKPKLKKCIGTVLIHVAEFIAITLKVKTLFFQVLLQCAHRSLI